MYIVGFGDGDSRLYVRPSSTPFEQSRKNNYLLD